MNYETVLYDAHDNIAWITLNRPEKLNAISAALSRDLGAALEEADTDEGVRCIVIKGAGRAFCAGADLTPAPQPGGYAEQPTDPYPNVRRDIERAKRGRQLYAQLFNVSKPVLCQVHGYCLAAGTHIATNCDIIIAAEDAQFGFPAVRNLGTPSTFLWSYHLDPQWTRWVMFTGDFFSGKQAEKMGLAWKAVPADKLEGEVNALARRIARVSYEMLAASKEVVNQAMELLGRRYLLQALAGEVDAISHQSTAVKEFHRKRAQEGLRAALEFMNAPFREENEGQRRS